MNRISGYNKTITELGSPPQSEVWNFYYGPTGMDKATRKQNGIQNLTMDFSTDSNGNILSMSYNETGGYSGELFAVSDNSGNIVAWSTILGINNYAAIRDPNNAYIDPIEIYNPNDINVPLGWNGKKGNNITIQQVGTGNDLIFNAGCSGGFLITNPWGATDITDSTTTTTTDDTTDKDGGDDAEPCNGGACAGTAPWYNFSMVDRVLVSIWILIIENGETVKTTMSLEWFEYRLTQSDEERLRSAGFAEDVIKGAGEYTGKCLVEKGGSMASCSPTTCITESGIKYCGLECSCKVGDNWTDETRICPFGDESRYV